MALFRTVVKKSDGQKWAYVEYSDENPSHCIVLGGKEFDSEEQAKEWSKGFDSFSYVWEEPNQRKIKELQLERSELEQRLYSINAELAVLEGGEQQ